MVGKIFSILVAGGFKGRAHLHGDSYCLVIGGHFDVLRHFIQAVVAIGNLAMGV
jgi:hypothetical protein